MRTPMLFCGAGAVVAALFFACGSDEDSLFPDGDAASTSSSSSSGASGVPGFQTDGGSNGSGGPAQPATPVDVVFTTDNAYKFGWGTKDGLASMQGSPANPTGNEIFPCPVGQGPEAYVVPGDEAPLEGYLYVVAWDDHDNTQGALGQFKRRGSDKVVYTGDPAWEVCATGLVYDARDAGAQGPPLDIVNAEMAKCAAGSGDKTKTSGGWVNAQGAITPGAVGKLMIGEDNSEGIVDGGVFPITCQEDDAGLGIDPAARWMWYSSDGLPHFQNDPDPRSFLIFRLPNSAVPPPPVN
ncbi:hypothetical protein EON77_04435 [bacterium]|nr:MAG: hypothetical protein EON77_04435 [bacterium]